jgi:hypothetical protein
VPKVEEMVEVVGLLRGQTAEAASLTKAIQEQKKALAIHSGLDDHAQTVITKKYTKTHTNNNLAKKGIAPVVWWCLCFSNMKMKMKTMIMMVVIWFLDFNLCPLKDLGN